MVHGMAGHTASLNQVLVSLHRETKYIVMQNLAGMTMWVYYILQSEKLLNFGLNQVGLDKAHCL